MPSKKAHGCTVHTFSSPDGSAALVCVPERGGVLSSLIMQGVEGPRQLLFQHDYFWDANLDDLPGGMPFAFPVFARLERLGQRGCYLFQGKQYFLPIHGFAWQEPWQIEELAPNRFSLILIDTPRTLAKYPFRFRIQLDYTINENELVCHQTYTNRGDHPLPYSAGFHPYFLTPSNLAQKAEVELDYQPTKRFLYNETFTDIIGEGKLFSLPASIQDPTINEGLTAVGSDKEVKLIYPDGDVLHLCAEGVEDENLFPYVQLYTIPDKTFFCAEPIMAPPNSLNTVSGMRWLAPGESEHGIFKIWLTRDKHD